MDVKSVICFKSLKEAISSHFEEDFGDRHSDVESTVDSFYQKGYCNEEEIEKNGMVVFEIKKHRIAHLNSAACYLKKDNKVLMIKFSKNGDMNMLHQVENLKKENHHLNVLLENFMRRQV